MVAPKARALTVMAGQGYGSVVNLCSDAGGWAPPEAVYSAATGVVIRLLQRNRQRSPTARAARINVPRAPGIVDFRRISHHQATLISAVDVDQRGSGTHSSTAHYEETS
ncbi:MAG: hypothetical protein ABJD68_03740 [Nakamurella sp.]